MSRNLAITLGLFLVLAMAASTRLGAQALSSATIQGTVKDASGGVLPNAALEILNSGTGNVQSLATDTQGRYIAPELPIGTYNVDIKLFSEGQLVTRTETAFEIVKVGFEQFVANTSRQNGFAYGLATVAMALMTGWMASIVFRKD